MDPIDLTEAEASILRDVVQNHLSELHTEISHTDDRDFKAALKRRLELLQDILQKLPVTVTPTV
jgi:glucose-6-phosphate 1-dehydrogenase